MAKLYVVGTPIGNLSDATPRMLETLGAVQLIAAEDTRVTGGLLRHFGIQCPMTSLHRHNEAAKAERIVARMTDEGIDVAVVTDAGTPAISDPGQVLVRLAAEAGHDVLAIPGPTALAAALSVSGFDARTFAFYGFLPREKGDLRKGLLSIARGPAVAVAYESPHRVTDIVDVIAQTLPGCRVCVCCDLTKLHEKTLRGDPDEVLAALRENPKTEKGEYCVVMDLHDVAVPETPQAQQDSVETQLFALMLKGQAPQEALEILVAQGIRKNDAKRALLRVRAVIDAGWRG